MLQITNPYQFFIGLDGLPLDAGQVYIGQPGQNPKTAPLDIYWDPQLTQPAAQPVGTISGYLTRNGTAARLYTSKEDFSILVTDKNGSLVFSSLEATALSNLETELSGPDGSSMVGHTPAGSMSTPTTVQDKLREFISIKDYGAVGDGIVDDTASIQAALDENEYVYAPAGTYKITSALKFNRPGQALKGAGKSSTVFTNLSSSDALFEFGDITNPTGWSPFSSLEDLRLVGNPSSISGVIIHGASTANPLWLDGSKDCSISNVRVDGVGAGYALEVRSWENQVSNFTIGIGSKCLRGVLLADEAQRNNFLSLYITGCDELSIKSGGSGISRGNVFIGTVVQQSGGLGGCIDLESSEATSFIGLYSESNNTKGAVRVIYIRSTCTGTTVQDMVHLSGGSVVIRNEGLGTRISNVTSSNITGAIVEVVGSTPTGIVTCVDWMPGVTPTGVKFGDTSTNKATTFIDGRSFLTDVIVSTFAPAVELRDRSDGSYWWQLMGDGIIHTMKFNSAQDGTFPNTAWRFNASVPEMVFDSLVRPDTDNTRNLGSSSRRWATIYAGTGTINTSDAREKVDVSELTDAEKRVATKLKNLVRTFKFKDAVQLKGAYARRHIGVMAQDVINVFKSENLNALDYGVVCHDEWPSLPEIRGEDGSLVQEGQDGGDRYGVRYEELFAFIIAVL